MQIFKASTYRLSKKETICLSSTLHELSLIVMWRDPYISYFIFTLCEIGKFRGSTVRKRYTGK
ncbi:hypothetical protein COI61_20015 [Bacillus cereus]|nr:hypothetical protein COI61_20015 [Bacillus cereus]PFS11460.1 hypothetical protein COK55_22480 [Bacillus cereus]